MGRIYNAEKWQTKKFWREFFRGRWRWPEVTFIDPTNTYLDAQTTIGKKTTIWPDVYIIGKEQKPVIGNGCEIGPMVVITDCEIGDNVYIGPKATIKLCRVGDRVKIPHDCYLARTAIGEETNIGYNTGTSDFDGFEKHAVTIDARCFIGTFVDIIAPVTIGEECFIASRTRFSTTAAIPPHSFVFEETRLKNNGGRVGRPHVAWKTNCSFKLPGYWKWIWTREPIDPAKMQEFFSLIADLIPDYPTWLKTPQPELRGDKPKDVIKKRGEEGLARVLRLATEQSLSILNI